MNRWVLQAGVIAYRADADEPRVVLITSTSRRRWVIPKGHIEEDSTAAESAVQEAWEEAGVRGDIQTPALGEYGYEKWGRRYRVEVFLLEVEREFADWPEAGVRKREWVTFRDAIRRVEEPKLKYLLRRAAAELAAPVR